MPRLIDADKAKEVLTDYYHIHTTIQRIALEEAFSQIPPVEAIPIDWINEHSDDYFVSGNEQFHLSKMLSAWEKENAAD